MLNSADKRVSVEKEGRKELKERMQWT